MRIDEGYIKFNLQWEEKPFDLNDQDFANIDFIRTKLFEKGLIGSYHNGIGFGNISIRTFNNEFIISGSATGNFKTLTKGQYSLVKKFNISDNTVQCQGLIKASSESMSHAAIYEKNSKVNSVIHVHHKNMWKEYLNNLSTTNQEAEFGTPEIALEIQKSAKQSSGIIIMGGHPEGIITYGQSIKEAYDILIKYYTNL